MDQTFTLESKQSNGKLILTTHGYINQVGGEQIAEQAYAAIDSGIFAIVLDLADSNVANSIGISILLEIIEKLQDVEGKLYMMNLSTSLDKMLTIMGLFHFAERISSVDEITV